MWFKTDMTVAHMIQIEILVSVDNAQLISVSYYTNMLSSKDTNNMLNVTIPDQIQICGSKLILQSFTYFGFAYKYLCTMHSYYSYHILKICRPEKILTNCLILINLSSYEYVMQNCYLSRWFNRNLYISISQWCQAKFSIMYYIYVVQYR